ncbi:LOW QUALITY PROTEIN: putative leucine-rich repeat receptor-like serine/threonine-protein kinase At2g19230 [Cornus florida]|uniref:LOW QUALITY PROTEIN: putative leucine-rich repeat receptor-like serine/threonine-protein kinase At2g19230 n=1 Tax=Cornus florida TaxID=4283 RepID=UPI00289FA43A|nr:LOW QUALITY PROTEIN: putative leucine-rich repeat receptor-like serine/threonine-protein kinase At2g19230 [Cornus florida]
MKVSFVFFACLELALLVLGQDQSGFISIDCGIPEGSNYTDATTGMYYSSDESFTDSGSGKTISTDYMTNSLEKQLQNVRSFPEGIRNCYTLTPEQGRGNKYLIRASFLYGNYDAKSEPPQFHLYIGADFWDTVTLEDQTTVVRKEIIHVLLTDYTYICLVNNGLGTPFISVLELRPLNNSMYETKSGSLKFYGRYDLGPTSNGLVRYKDDVYDRIWYPIDFNFRNTLSTLSEVYSQNSIYKTPSKVLSTAITSDSNDSMSFSWPNNSTYEFYIYLYFAEIELLKGNQSREFYIYLNGDLWFDEPVVPLYLSSDIIYSTSSVSYPKFDFSFNKTSKSTHPPILNAMELYTVKQFSNIHTDDRDAAAIISIKSMYGVSKNWQGDPCAPEDYIWFGLNCSYVGIKPPRIISLNLSASNLTGEVAPYISDLTLIQSLDLSNNNLTGQVPAFLSRLPSLKVLNLKGNNFTGPIPAELIMRSNNGSLSMSIDESEGENANPSQPIPPKKKKNKIVPVLAAITAVLLLAAIMAVLWIVTKRKQQVVVREEDAETKQRERSLEVKSCRLTYSEVMNATNNFRRVIGKGGFGTVYHGYLGNHQVAVKMLAPSSIQGYKEFQAEADLLTSVRHKNLTSLVGYCKEGTNMAIIYEYMANGNLKRHLLDRNLNVLGWEERLRIAMDAAQGLEYLHHGCKPPIIHRDVKTTNILLNENFQAKLSDFGLSRVFPTEGGSHVSTIVAGSPGYLDPEYCTSNRLREKSDVYSFGIVLLETITSRPPIPEGHDDTHIIQWVSSKLANGDIKSIVDPRLHRDFNVNSVWKAVELAMSCVSRNPTRRPTMNYVVMELRECLRQR